MPRPNTRNRGYTFDARTGFKEKGRKLSEDGERPGLWTRDRDDIHPQRFPVVPGPDGAHFRPGVPAPHSIPIEVALRLSFDRHRPITAVNGARFIVEVT